MELDVELWLWDKVWDWKLEVDAVDIVAMGQSMGLEIDADDIVAMGQSMGLDKVGIGGDKEWDWK